MRQTIFSKLTGFIVLVSSILICACGDDNKNSKSGNNDVSTDLQVCNCELNDNSCINNCIRTVCSCNSSDSIENCAQNCDVANECGIVSVDMNPEMDPFDPSSWEMQVKVEVTNNTQITCLQSSVKECDDDSFEKTCDNDKVKSCVDGHFYYKDCPNGCTSGSCNADTHDEEETCDSTFKRVCDGDRVKSCDRNEITYQDCPYGCNESEGECIQANFTCQDGHCDYDESNLPVKYTKCDINNSENKCLGNGKIAAVCMNVSGEFRWVVVKDCETACITPSTSGAALSGHSKDTMLGGCGWDPDINEALKGSVFNINDFNLNPEEIPDGTYGYAYAVIDELVANVPVTILTGTNETRYAIFESNDHILCDTLPKDNFSLTPCTSGAACMAGDNCLKTHYMSTCYNDKMVIAYCSNCFNNAHNEAQCMVLSY